MSTINAGPDRNGESGAHVKDLYLFFAFSICRESDIAISHDVDNGLKYNNDISLINKITYFAE